MIFQCTNCRARFRVADEKVPERGVKVRCTKCTVIFKVTRADAVDTSARDPRTGGTPSPQPHQPPQPPARRAPAPPPATPGKQPTPDSFGIDLDLNVDLASPPSSASASAALNRAPEQPATRLPPMPPMQAGRQATEGPPTPADPFAALDLALALAPSPSPTQAPPRAPSPNPRANDEVGDVSFDALDPFAQFTNELESGTENHPTAQAPDAFELDPFADEQPALEDDPFAAPPPTTRTFGRPAASLTPSPSAALSSQEQGARLALDDDFATSLRQGSEATSGGQIFDFGEVTGGSALDLNLTGAGSSSASSAADFGKLALAQKVGVPSAPSTEPSRRAFRREFASSLFNVTSAFIVGFAALVAIASLRSPRALTADDLGFDLVWMAMGYTQPVADEEQLRALNVRTGTYRTHSGEELFYVRGDVDNASSANHRAVQVVVEVFSKSEIIGRAESIGRLDAGPEELFALEDRDNNTLQKRLVADTPSLTVAARARVPFIAVFPLNAKQVDGARVKLSVVDGVPAALRDSVAQKPESQPAASEDDADLAAATEAP